MKSVSILGSTGSIGLATLEVLRSLPDKFFVKSLLARRQWNTLLRQAEAFHSQVIGVGSADAADRLREQPLPAGVELIPATAAGAFMADIVVNAIPGSAGLRFSWEAIRTGRRLALANKESMVMAGALLRQEAARTGAQIIPVDSEHSAIFQALQAGKSTEVRRLLLTASGGPFLRTPIEQFPSITRAQALRHPVWQMGEKVTIESAALLNKALEIVEARWLFDVPADRIEVLIHPQSIIHSMVEFCDGSIMAQLGAPDMRIPIQYALTYPDRHPGPGTRLDWTLVKELAFELPDRERFPSLDFGYDAARDGSTLGVVLNAADEVAVNAFLENKITFPHIFAVVRQAMNRYADAPKPDGIEEVLQLSQRVSSEVRQTVLQKGSP